MDAQTEGTKPPRPWLRNNLVALGSAAVFSVYSAGYFRTREAAARFAGETVQRHAAAIAAKPEVADHEVHPEAAPPKHSAELPVMRLSSKSKPETHAQQEATPPVATAQPAPRAVDSTVIAAVPEPVPAPAPASVTSTPAPAPPTAVAPVDSTVAAPDKKVGGALKDGVYYGWGTSRHGDIQASVEVKNGRIVGAYISQCLTQYSCSWVSALPGQVVDRQSAEVDYVSGATQSSNAFYYAVADALKKAK
ncbi:MAG: FMN-binding protein [Gemmatimonadaceae bacterium]